MPFISSPLVYHRADLPGLNSASGAAWFTAAKLLFLDIFFDLMAQS